MKKSKIKKNLKTSIKKSTFDLFELKRQCFHAATGIIILLLLIFDIFNEWILAGILVVGFIIYLLNKKLKVPIIWWFVRHFERKENLETIPGRGSFYFVFGIFIALILFPKDVAYTAIIVLSLGDSISTFIGKTYGRIKPPWSNIKLLEGTISGIALSFAGFMVLYFYLPNFSIAVWHGLVACTIAMLIEAVEIKIEERKLDDNIVIPITVGAIITILRGF